MNLYLIQYTHCNNGFPFNVVKTDITNEITEFNKIKQAVQNAVFIYVFVSWMELVRDLLSKSHKLFKGTIF